MFAHHSFSATYDSSQKVEIEGVVKEFVWRNPHSFMRIDVTDKDGTVKTWALEWGSTNDLTQAKITQDDAQARRQAQGDRRSAAR